MIGGETSIGGNRQDFPPTAWSLVLVRREDGPECRREQMERLASLYWKPIYSYIRGRWNRPVEDAKDLTQQFFSWMIDSDLLSKVQSNRGRFRNFVKTTLDRFVMGQYDAERRLKRGGDRIHVSLDFVCARGEEPRSADGDPAQLLDKQWRRALIDEALERLREHYRVENKQSQHAVFEEFYLAPEPGPSYKELAERHGLSTVDVSNYIARAKSRFRAFIEELILQGVAGPQELSEEFEELFGRDE